MHSSQDKVLNLLKDTRWTMSNVCSTTPDTADILEDFLKVFNDTPEPNTSDHDPIKIDDLFGDMQASDHIDIDTNRSVKETVTCDTTQPLASTNTIVSRTSRAFYVSKRLGDCKGKEEVLSEFCKSHNIPYDISVQTEDSCVHLPVSLQHLGYSYYLQTLKDVPQCSLKHILRHVECIEHNKIVIGHQEDSFLPKTHRFSDEETTLQAFYENDRESFDNVDWIAVFRANDNCRKRKINMIYPTTISIQGNEKPSPFCLVDITKMNQTFTNKKRRGQIKGVGGSSGIPRSNFYANQVKLVPSIFNTARRQYPINPPQFCAIIEVDDTTASTMYNTDSTISFMLDGLPYERMNEPYGQFVIRENASGKLHYAGVFYTDVETNVITYTTYASMQLPVIRIVQDVLNCSEPSTK